MHKKGIACGVVIFLRVYVCYKKQQRHYGLSAWKDIYAQQVAML
eukprot:SAG31_NODE_3737_length_3936_cov_2.743028_3_plen_44_part_00